jgi:hypothetical protein
MRWTDSTTGRSRSFANAGTSESAVAIGTSPLRASAETSESVATRSDAVRCFPPSASTLPSRLPA